MGFQDLWVKNVGFYGENTGKGGAILTPKELVFTDTSVSNLVKIDEEMRP